MKRLIAGIAGVAVIALASNASALVCYDQSDLTAAGANATVVWGDDPGEDEIVMTETMFVKNNQTLQILPGTIIRGLPRLDLVASAASAPGSLIVTQNGKIEAIGSPSAPIVFTTAAMDNDADDNPDPKPGDATFYERWDCVSAVTFYDADPLNVTRPPLAENGRNNVQLWGGLVILGNAPTNLDRKAIELGTRAGFGKGFVEGLAALAFPLADLTYGGQYPHDNSGTLKYVRVQFGGDEIGTANEINGVTLGAIGDATTISHVEVYVNFDDGFEWFGGTVNGDHLSVIFAGDDQFDADQGYTGMNQNLFAVLPHFTASVVDPRTGSTNFGSESGDEGCECDGDDLGGSTPSGELIGNFSPWGGMAVAFSDQFPVDTGDGDFDNYPGRAHFAQFYNLTILSHDGISSPEFTPTAAANGGIQMRNGFGGIFANSIVVNTGGELPIDCTSTRMDGYNCADNAAKTSIASRSPVVRIVSSVFDGYSGSISGDNLQPLTNGDAMDTNSSYHNIVSGGGFSGLGQDDYTFDPEASATGYVLGIGLKPGKGKIDPVPSGSAGYDFGQSDGLDPSVNYRGAFEKGAPLWTTGWSALSVGGLL